MTNSQGTLVDLIDRILDRGLVIDADVIISLAGVPLIAINLRAALAGVETMLEHRRTDEWYRNSSTGQPWPQLEASSALSERR